MHKCIQTLTPWNVGIRIALSAAEGTKHSNDTALPCPTPSALEGVGQGAARPADSGFIHF